MYINRMNYEHKSYALIIFTSTNNMFLKLQSQETIACNQALIIKI